jgi:hypothetical protein
VHVREVEAAQLVEARRDLEEAGDPVQPALAPEAGVGGRRALGGEEVVALQVPDRASALPLDGGRLEGGDQAAPRLLEILRRAGRQGRGRLAVAARGRRGRRLAPAGDLSAP